MSRGGASADATAVLSEYAVGVGAERIPAEVVERARLVLADTVGVILAASAHRAVGVALAAFPLGDGECTVVGHGPGARPEVAALINGIGAHDIELDDGGRGIGHAAAIVVPATLAAAELSGDATYGDVLAALVAGYDVQARVAQAMGGTVALHDRGFHPSSVCGSLGAAAAAGRVLRISTEQMRSCIGLAASQSSGLLTFRDEASHMLKSFQTGIAARNGVTAALLARAGYLAAPDVLTGRNNLLTPFAGSAAVPAKLESELGERFEICLTVLKRHASCIQTHAAVDALIDVLAEERLSVEAIHAVDVQLANRAIPRIDGNPLLTHNIQYVMAIAAHERRVIPAHFSERWRSRDEIWQLAERVSLRGSDDLDASFPDKQGAVVSITVGEETFTKRAAEPRGGPTHPLSRAELKDKFVELAGDVLGRAGSFAAWDRLATASLGEEAGSVLGPVLRLP